MTERATGSLALSAYLAASTALGPLAPALLAHRRRKGKEDPDRLGERIGRPSAARSAGPVVWLHGASVGEGTSLLPLVERLMALPAAPFCLLTTGTVTSAALIAPRLAAMKPEGRALHQFVPVDTRSAVRGFLEHWRPDLAIWAESEFWPRLMWETAGAGVPMMLVNARLSAKSADAWKRMPGMARRLLGLFARVDAQDDVSAALLAGLGAEPSTLHVSGNVKTLLPPPSAGGSALEALRSMLGSRRLWLAASTHAPEEAAALDAHLSLESGAGARGDPGPLLTMIAPRHPERGEEVARMAALRGLPHARRSRGEGPPSESGVWILDTLGEMGLWYRLASVVFVGGSLAPMGGHNPFEPTALGAALIAGPSTRNFAPAYAALAEGDGYRAINGAEALGPAVAALMEDEAARLRMAAAAAEALAAAKPDLDPIIDAAEALMTAKVSG
ncbi:MAG: 3-deoxy-D-manno-octulosonic acid transferase [Pseudomonadota bacterium]